MWHDRRFYQHSSSQENVNSLNDAVDDRQNQNHIYQNLVPDPQYYHHYHDARSSTAQYLLVPPPPQPSPSPLFYVTSSPNISYQFMMNEICQAELNRLKIDVRICREILTIQMKMNAILLGRYFRQ